MNRWLLTADNQQMDHFEVHLPLLLSSCDKNNLSCEGFLCIYSDTTKCHRLSGGLMSQMRCDWRADDMWGWLDFRCTLRKMSEGQTSAKEYTMSFKKGTGVLGTDCNKTLRDIWSHKFGLNEVQSITLSTCGNIEGKLLILKVFQPGS